MFVFLTKGQLAKMPCHTVLPDFEGMENCEFLIGFFTQVGDDCYFTLVDGANTYRNASTVVHYLNGGTHKTVTVGDE